MGYHSKENYVHSALVKNTLAKQIDKSETRSNWIRRPLTDAQLNYAASDVEFLIEIYLKQAKFLVRENKMDWLKEEINFQQSAKDLLITSQLRSAMIFNKEIKATNYQIDTYKKKIFIYGIAHTSEERKKVIDEAKEILDVEDVIASILLVDDLRIQKN